MSPALDKYLCKKYPKIFSERNMSPKVTCMCWGFPNDGWLFLIDELCHNIQHHIDNPNWIQNPKTKLFEKPKEPTCPQVVASQVKEKFGGLRFYYSGGDEYVSALVNFAESMSYRICEDCGRMDETVSHNSKGWIRNTCEKCTPAEHLKDHKKVRDKKMVKALERAKTSPKEDAFADMMKIVKRHKLFRKKKTNESK